MIASHYSQQLREFVLLFSQEKFEEWAMKQIPTFPLGTIKINGRFDRYFDPETQAAWEGFQKAGNIAANAFYKLEQGKNK
nr:MAG TPA: hypothetical protein [Caudoviricetes sp.]